MRIALILLLVLGIIGLAAVLGGILHAMGADDKVNA